VRVFGYGEASGTDIDGDLELEEMRSCAAGRN
jgi:hypothetical protein